MTNENEPRLKIWDASRIRTEVKVISHVGMPTSGSNPFLHGNSRRVWFADGTYADAWNGAEVVNQLADRSLVGVPLEVTFSGTAIIGVKRADEPDDKRTASEEGVNVFSPEYTGLLSTDYEDEQIAPFVVDDEITANDVVRAFRKGFHKSHDKRTDEAELPKVFGVVYPTAREQEMTEAIISEKQDDEVLAASDLVRAYRVGYADGRDYRLGKMR